MDIDKEFEKFYDELENRPSLIDFKIDLSKVKKLKLRKFDFNFSKFDKKNQIQPKKFEIKEININNINIKKDKTEIKKTEKLF